VYVLPYLRSFRGPIERGVKRAIGTRGKVKEMSKETENEEPQGGVERETRSAKRTLRRCVACEFPSLTAVVFVVLVLTAKLRVCGGRRGKAPLTIILGNLWQSLYMQVYFSFLLLKHKQTL
jgi:hypothetical protein